MQKTKKDVIKKTRAAHYVYFKSLTSIKYYRDMLKTDLSFSLKYYVVLALLFTLVTSLFSTIQLLPKIERGLNNFAEYALSLYEEDLVITVSDGELSINKEEPYIVPLEGQLGDLPENLVVFDSEGSLDDMEATYDTLVLVNEKNIIVNYSSRIDVIPLSELPDVTITQADFAAAVEQLRSLIRFVPYIVGIVFVLAMLFYYLILRLIYLLFVALLLWALGAIRGLSMSYVKYYKVALHTMSLPLTIGLISSVFALQVYLPNWFFLLNLIFGALVIMSLDGSEEGENAAVTEELEGPGGQEDLGDSQDLQGSEESGESGDLEEVEGEVIE